MKLTSTVNSKTGSNLGNVEDVKYLTLLCAQRSDLIIKTEFGLGHYNFLKFSELNGILVLEFNLMDDKKYNDTSSIFTHIGKTCFLTAEQYLSVYSYIAEA
jgi:hypothetical protein